MKFTGLQIQRFRSIGPEGVLLHPWSKCNILIGQNNSGKSNVLRAVDFFIKRVFDRNHHLNPLDYYRRVADTPASFRVFFEIEGDELPEVRKLLKTKDLFIEFSAGQSGIGSFGVSNSTFAEIADFETANRILKELTGARWTQGVTREVIHTEFTEKRGSEIFDRHFRAQFPKKIETIPEFRKSERANEYEFNGKGLIELLASYQHPEIGQDKNQSKFEKIQDTIRRLLDLPSAIIEIPTSHENIIINNDGLRLPLSSYGTGVHELAILITAVLSLDGAICCIEEPEIHLHPILQREFIRFLIEETNNQYLITSHSPAFINAQAEITNNDVGMLKVFLLRRHAGSTLGEPIIDRAQVLVATTELGVKPSDILHSNCIIWVEGPSDRTFINRWLELVDPTLEEGRHYSIMFYGGRLVSNLSLNSEDIPTELIPLLRINQRAIVVIDSDKDRPRKKLNDTKLRIMRECENSDSHCWITEGREIENYIGTRVLVEWLSRKNNIVPPPELGVDFGKYEKADEVINRISELLGIESMSYSENKLKYSRELIEHFSADDIAGLLKRKVEAIVSLIRGWND